MKLRGYTRPRPDEIVRDARALVDGKWKALAKELGWSERTGATGRRPCSSCDSEKNGNGKGNGNGKDKDNGKDNGKGNGKSKDKDNDNGGGQECPPYMSRLELWRCYASGTMAKPEGLLGTPHLGWPWPDSLDALIAAPGQHTLLFENEQVRVIRTRILPGQMVPVHTHRWPAVLTLSSWSDFVRRDAQGNVLLDTRLTLEASPLHTPLWLEPLAPHSVENVGDAEINNVQVEIKGLPVRADLTP